MAVTNVNTRPTAYKNPLTVAVWLALSGIFIQYMEWWPGNAHGFYEYLKPLPAVFSMALPIMFLIDWSVNSSSFLTFFDHTGLLKAQSPKI